jgi:hypothetical protein
MDGGVDLPRDLPRRHEGAVVRHNMAWTLVTLAYLVVIGVVLPAVAPQAFA